MISILTSYFQIRQENQKQGAGIGLRTHW